MAKAGFGGLGMLAILIMARVLPRVNPPEPSFRCLFWPTSLPSIPTGHTPRQCCSRDAAARSYRNNLRMAADAAHPGAELWAVHRLAHSGARRPRARPKFAPRLMNFAVEHPGIAWPFSWLAGSTTMIANAAGPVMTIYLLACRLPKFEFVGTAAWFFFAINLLKVPFSASLGSSIRPVSS